MPAVVNTDECDACGSCVEVCPVDAITVEEYAIIDEDECIDCNACVDECPNEAIVME